MNNVRIHKNIINEQCKDTKGTHNANSIIESKVIYYLEQYGLRV